MKKRLRKKLEKEDIFIKNFASEYKKLKKTKEENIYSQKIINNLRCYISEITPKEVVISKSMYFGLVGYLPKDLKLLLSSYKNMKFPFKLGGIQLLIGNGIVDERGNQQGQKILEELYIEEINESKRYIMFLFKGFQIRIKVPIAIQHIKTQLRGVNTETTCWNWDFIHAGIRVVSDNDFSSLIVFYKTAVELGSLMGMDEKNIGKYKSLEESLGDY